MIGVRVQVPPFPFLKKQIIDSFSRLKNSELIENEFSLTFKNGSSNEVKHQTIRIEDLSLGILRKSFCEKIIELKTI